MSSPSLKVICGWVLPVLLLSAGGAWSWGPESHELITREAIAILPAQMRAFYEPNARYIVPLSNLPDDWRESHKSAVSPEHYIDLDLLGSPPFSNLATDRKTAEKRFGKQKLLRVGVLPWAIKERYDRLVEAMRKPDAIEVVVQSAVLAHYVGDAHVPFHTTKDYDGRTQGQKGIHFRWEESLASFVVRPEKVRPREPESVNDVIKCAFDWCISSYKLVDPILKADDRARSIDPGHGFKYYRSLAEDTGSMLIRRLESASEALAGIWLSAWKQAGKPNLPARHAP
ncbi:MAG: S1/P1 nuclease, partial [Armatimonadota bacterium]